MLNPRNVRLRYAQQLGDIQLAHTHLATQLGKRHNVPDRLLILLNSCPSGPVGLPSARSAQGLVFVMGAVLPVASLSAALQTADQLRGLPPDAMRPTGRSYLHHDRLYLAIAKIAASPLLDADPRLRRTLGTRFPQELWLARFAATGAS